MIAGITTAAGTFTGCGKVGAMRLVVLAVVACAGVARADSGHELADLLARTDALAKEVAHVRGLPLKHAIPKEVVDRKELRERLDKIAAADKTTAADGLALARWGMIPLDLPYAQLVVDLMVDQIAGYYDPETKKLTISEAAADDPTWAEMVLAHELDHGLQDQSFDLHKLEDVEGGDASLARHALVEGDGIALMVELMYSRHGHVAPWGDPHVAADLERAMMMPAGDSLDRAPLAVRETMLFPYRAGFGFVAALRRRQPWSAVDAAFARPPRSTEQVLHLDKYEQDEKPIAVVATVPASLAGYAIAQSTVWGELGFDVFLRAHGVGELAAQEAAAGWGGDRVIVLAHEGDTKAEHAIGIARLEWDTDIDAVEAAESAVRALDAPGGVVAQSPTRIEWLGLDGTRSWVERRGKSLVIVVGAPAVVADALAAEAWTALAVSTPPKRKHK
jgi:hypothetical protein